jgi:hypothetical protein
MKKENNVDYLDILLKIKNKNTSYGCLLVKNKVSPRRLTYSKNISLESDWYNNYTENIKDITIKQLESDSDLSYLHNNSKNIIFYSDYFLKFSNFSEKSLFSDSNLRVNLFPMLKFDYDRRARSIYYGIQLNSTAYVDCVSFVPNYQSLYKRMVSFRLLYSSRDNLFKTFKKSFLSKRTIFLSYSASRLDLTQRLKQLSSSRFNKSFVKNLY